VLMTSAGDEAIAARARAAGSGISQETVFPG